MKKPIYIFDPTFKDSLSRFRGIGRYVELLRSSFSRKFTFCDDINDIPKSSIFINPFFTFFEEPLISEKKFAKQIAVIHDIIPLIYKSHFPKGVKGTLNFFKNKKALTFYDLIITDSQKSKKDIVNILKINEKNIRVVYPSTLNKFLKTDPEKPNFISEKLSKFLLYVGDATWNKNLVNIARALKENSITCIFAGKVFKSNPETLNHSWQKELKKFLEIARDDERFLFPGFVKDNELIWLYQNVHLNILVSNDEGFGLSYIEAASQKTPSLLSDIEVFKEIAQDNAFFANAKDYKDIAEKIKTISGDLGLRNTIGEEAYERSKFFSQDQFKLEFSKAILE
jgi:glycosyltransferase involved in cell wall biosynthesis